VSALARPSAAPFIKWAGGKTQLLAQLAPLLPPDVRRCRYHEPFLGGGALYFYLRPARAVLSDQNAHLIAAWNAVQREPEPLIAALLPLEAGHSEDQYYAVRARWNGERERLTPLERAALFIYLNKTGYNGLWRVNSRGDNNVPAGRYQHPRVVDPELVRADAELLRRRARLLVAPFETVLARAGAGDFVYLDPPYHPRSETASFTAYVEGGFGESDHRRLAEVVAQLDRRGCRVLLSNSDGAFVRELYHGLDVRGVRATRSINSKAVRRGTITELVIRNYR
jgi:DNA adenine methylase